MASYEAWSRALLTYFVEGAQRGASIFLSVDDDVLDRVAANVGLVEGRGIALDDFCRAVRGRVVGSDGRIHHTALVGAHGPSRKPLEVGFLSAMVLAASHMAAQLEEGEAISELNYFRRLREVLGLADVAGRPSGLPSGAEEPIWQSWNRWLQRMGFLPTARRGAGPQTYIAYPISQTMLRQADKERLRKLFRDRHWRTAWDADTLFAQVRREAHTLSHHLQDLLRANDRQRIQALTEAIADVYETWLVDPQLSPTHVRSFTVNLYAHLYRVEDPLFDTVEYRLYPRQPRGQRLEEVVVNTPVGTEELREERRGWYQPLSLVEEEALNHGLQWRIQSPPALRALIFPQREFWILVPDSEHPDSGVFASWGAPKLGAQFVILCKRSLLPQLQRLRDERLVAWEGDPRDPFGGSQWVEVRDCQVTSQAWSGVFIENDELREALRPSISLDVSLSGGLRAPNMAAWIQDHGPQVTVFGFCPEVEVSVVNVEDEKMVYSGNHKANEPFEVPWHRPGDFRIAAEAGADLDEQLVKIISWDDVRMRAPEEMQSLSFGDWVIGGALVEAGS